MLSRLLSNIVLDELDKELEKRAVKTGIGNWTFTEIVSGVNEGDVLVRTPDQAGLAENQEVIVIAE